MRLLHLDKSCIQQSCFLSAFCFILLVIVIICNRNKVLIIYFLLFFFISTACRARVPHSSIMVPSDAFFFTESQFIANKSIIWFCVVALLNINNTVWQFHTKMLPLQQVFIASNSIYWLLKNSFEDVGLWIKIRFPVNCGISQIILSKAVFNRLSKLTIKVCMFNLWIFKVILSVNLTIWRGFPCLHLSLC